MGLYRQLKSGFTVKYNASDKWDQIECDEYGPYFRKPRKGHAITGFPPSGE
jgi:hypothetical protein